MASSLEYYSIYATLDTTYRYETLPLGDHMRVLKLEPGQGDDPVVCRLEVVSIEDAWRNYEAISYVWGDPEDRRDINLDGHRFPVTTSLFDALHHFRLPDTELSLWADSICIQQSNPPEKGRQVQLMGKIYEGAQRVRVWLGNDPAGAARETITFIQSQARVGQVLAARYGGVRAIPSLPAAENPVSQDPAKWALYQRFVELPWFTRVWVIQEVGLARDVTMYWGGVELAFSDLINVNEFMFYAPQLYSVWPLAWELHDVFVGVFNQYGNPESWRDQLIPDIPIEAQQLAPGSNLIGVLIQGCRRNVTDLRDYIYAFLAHPLARNGDEPIVIPDYEKPVDDLFFEVSVKILKWFDPSRALAMPGCMGIRSPPDLDSDQPSWVTRWELGRRVASLGIPGHWHYAGGEGQKPSIDIDEATKTLKLPGVVFDNVSWISGIIHREDAAIDSLIANPNRVPAVEWVWSDLKEQPCRYPEADRYDMMTLTLVAGRYGPAQKAEDDMPHHRRTAAAYSRYIAYARQAAVAGAKLPEADRAEETQLRADARDYEDTYGWTIPERRFFVTEKGFYGIGPPLMKAGDRVVVVPGLIVPYVVRPTLTADRYKLVGVAYVHGVMRGELLDPSDPLKLGAGEAKEIVIV